jgi:hypothetical protein
MTPHEKAFHETLYALGQEQLDNLIIVGGWCPYLYAKYVWRCIALFPSTVDIDFAVKKMSPDKFSESAYKKLIKANLIPRKMDMDDENRIQFAYLAGKLLIPVEFVTSPSVLPRGQKSRLKPYVACDPVPEVDIALKASPIRQTIAVKGKNLYVQIASAAAFIIVKSLLIRHRANTTKLPKDLASIAFVLRYAPQMQKILDEIQLLRKHPSFAEFSKIVRDLFQSEEGQGYGMLAPFFKQWGILEERIREQIKKTFEPLLDVIGKK